MDLDKVKTAAEKFRKLYYPNCLHSKVEIGNCMTLDEMRHTVIMYRDFISTFPYIGYIIHECSDELEYLGLRVQLQLNKPARIYFINPTNKTQYYARN